MSLLAEGAAGGRQLFEMLAVFAPILIIFYFLLIRPQKKKEAKRRALIDALKKNDEVITIGGIHGVITGLKDDEVTLKVDETSNVKLRMNRSAISRVVNAPGMDGDGTS